MALPRIIFVREEPDTDGSKYLLAYAKRADAVGGDGPTLVGTYQFVSKQRLVKVVGPQKEGGK